MLSSRLFQLGIRARSNGVVGLPGDPDRERPSPPPAFVTISVDDGHPSDLTTAALLGKFDLKATFYVPRSNPERPVIGPPQIRELARTFEVGGHTLSHLALPKLGMDAAWKEIRGCKDWLQDLLGRPAVSFCYPQGKYTEKVRSLVAQAGFIGARTCQFDLNCLPADPFQAGVSTHAYTHSVAVRLRHALLQGNARGVFTFFEVSRMATDWELHFRRVLNWVEINGGVAHLYLHSWEVEQRDEWDKLKRVFQDAASRKRVVPITNGELFDLAATTKSGIYAGAAAL